MNLNAVSQETLDQMAEPLQKALSTGYTTALGLTGYELAAPAKFLVPVLSPWRNSLPRVQAPVGSTASTWRSITGINVARQSPSVGFGYAGALVETSTQTNVAAYQPLALGDSVQMDAQVLARGFDDLRARSGTNLLYSLMIAEDQMLLGSQNFSLGTPTAPTVTFSGNGAIPTTTAVHVKVVARTVENFWFGGGTLPSADGTATTSAASQTATFTTPAVAGAVAYDWYVGASTSAYYYAGSTPYNTFSVTAIPGADSTASQTATPGIAPARSGAGTSLSSFTDTSADPNAFNGLLGSLLGDVSASGSIVQRGTGTNQGAYFASLDGATLTGSNGSITQIDTALLSLWNNSRISPTRMLVSAQQHMDISNKIIATGGATTMFDPTNLTQRQNGVSGGFVNTYVNKAANGMPIDMVTEPNLPNGTVVLISDSLPYPDNSVTNVYEVETQQEYQQLEYPPARVMSNALGGPRYDLEVRAIEVFKSFAPFTAAVLQNVAAG